MRNGLIGLRTAAAGADAEGAVEVLAARGCVAGSGTEAGGADGVGRGMRSAGAPATALAAAAGTAGEGAHGREAVPGVLGMAGPGTKGVAERGREGVAAADACGSCRGGKAGAGAVPHGMVDDAAGLC